MKKVMTAILVLAMIFAFSATAFAAKGSAYGSYGPNSTYNTDRSSRPLAVDGSGLCVTGEEFNSMLYGLLKGEYKDYQEFNFPVTQSQGSDTGAYYYDCMNGTSFQMICGVMDNSGNVTPAEETDTVQNISLWGFLNEEDDMMSFQLCAVNMIFLTYPADDTFSMPATIMLDLTGDNFGRFVKYGSVEYKFDYYPEMYEGKDAVFFTVRNAINIFKQGQIVTFGTYEQDGNLNNGPEPIDWIVLLADEHEALLISLYGLDAVPFHSEYCEISWEKCDLRSWMNDTFFNTAFSAKEQNAIETVTLDNNNGYESSTMWRTMRDGPETTDKVFPLSCQQAEQIFGYKSGYNGFRLTVLRGNGICEPTPYALSQGAKIDENDNSCCYWWMRSVATQTFQAAYVSPLGSEGTLGCAAKDICVRPAILIDLDLLH